MKKGTIIIYTAIAVIGFTAFGFINKEQIVEAMSMNSNAVLPDQTNATAKVAGLDFSELPTARMNDDLWYMVKGSYGRPTTKEKLSNAQLVSDVIPGYPTNWIDEYIAVEVTSSHDGMEVKTISPNDVLSAEQKLLFSSVDLATDINIIVKYKIRNAVTNILEPEEMNITMTVVPEVEAEYIGGYDSMISYLKENSLDKISDKNINQDKAITVTFIVNEEGGIENVALKDASGDEEVDNLLIELIDKMPKWKPAENSMGVKVKQPFQFTLGHPGC